MMRDNQIEMRYLENDLVPFVRGSDTSEEAAQSVSAFVVSKCAAVLRLIISAGAKGYTCDEIEIITGFPHQTASARIRQLAKASKVKDSTERRLTRSKRQAVVWVAVKP